MRDFFPYDIETYPNLFSMVIVDALKQKYKTFEVSPWRNDFPALVKLFRWLANYKHQMVGFNNIAFDYPVLHHMLVSCGENAPAEQINRVAYNKAQEIIDTPWDDRFRHTIWESDHFVTQIDLYKIHHFDNQARATSLKMLEFCMRMNDIKDLPYPPGATLTERQAQEVITYNRHDVDATADFLQETVDKIEFRHKMTDAYGVNMLNYNDTKIGESILIHRLEEQLGDTACYYREDGRRRPRQTPRSEIALRDVVLPLVNFKRPEFNAILQWFNERVITETKGVFSEIPFEDVEVIKPYADLSPKNKKLKELNVVVDGFKFVFGTGGIHGSIDPCTVVADDEYDIIDADVTSLYPSISIVNQLYPEHLTDAFVPIYEGIFHERARHAKGTMENAALKLALNGSYGKSNSKYSPLFDPQFTMAITINGQLQLCMLSERLMELEDVTWILIAARRSI